MMKLAAERRQRPGAWGAVRRWLVVCLVLPAALAPRLAPVAAGASNATNGTNSTALVLGGRLTRCLRVNGLPRKLILRSYYRDFKHHEEWTKQNLQSRSRLTLERQPLRTRAQLP